MPITPASELRHFKYSRGMLLEPSFGCRLQCRQCSLETPAGRLHFMNPRLLDLQLKEIKKIDSDRLIQYIDYTGRGNPLDNKNLHEITQVVRRHFPKARLGSFWNLDGVPTQNALIRRTNGLDCLVLSFDAHHYAGHFRIQKQGAPGLSASQLREKTLKSMFEKLRWAITASKQHGFKIQVRFTGSEKERSFFENHPVFKKISENLLIDHSRRVPRGSTLGTRGDDNMPFMNDVTISHDLAVEHYFLRPK